jgi:LacI family transcriptional regulator
VANHRSVTITDIAREAGMSPSTVSRVINRRGYISEDTIQKVEQAMESLGYRPMATSRGSSGSTTKLVGLIIPDLSNVFYTSVAMATSRMLNALEYEMILCIHEENPDKNLGFLKILEDRGVDGIIYAHPANGNNSDELRALVARGMPIVEINRQREVDLLDAVLPDNLRGAQQGTDYLLSLGHKRIGFITGRSSTTTGSERLLGYQISMSRMGLPIDNDLVKVGDFSRAWGEKATRELMNLPNPPTAIFATSNRIALGSLQVLNEMKIRIPENISVISFDDSDWLSASSPPITAVDIAIDEMAKLSVQLLHSRIDGSTQKPVSYHLGTSLVVRQSCKRIS